MSKQLSELCTLLVGHHFGELPHFTYSILEDYGRSRIGSLTQVSGKLPKYVKNGLAILLSKSLVTAYPPGPPGFTCYQANEQQTLNTLRFGRNIELIQRRLGADAGDLVSAAEVLGVATESQLLEESRFLQHSHDSGLQLNGINGETEGARHGTQSGSQILQTMQELGFFEEIRQDSLISHTDLSLVCGDWLREHDRRFQKSITGPKKSVEYHEALEEKKQRIKRGIDNLNDPNLIVEDSTNTTTQSLPNKKRKIEKDDDRDIGQVVAGQQEKPSKRRKQGKIAGSPVNTTRIKAKHDDKSNVSWEGDGAENDPETLQDGQRSLPSYVSDLTAQHSSQPSLKANFLRLNAARFVQAYRSEALANFAARRLGDNAGKVYAALLRVVEETQSRLMFHSGDKEEGDVRVSTAQVVEALDSSALTNLGDESEAIQTDHHRTIALDFDEETPDISDQTPSLKAAKKAKKTINGAMKHKSKLKDSQESHLNQLVEHQLSILAEEPQAFVHCDPHFMLWSVDHHRLVRDLAQFEIERTVNAKLGPTARRLVRILHQKGKLEEKQLGNFGLIQQNELRTTLALMQEAGFVEVQEIPRDNGRTLNRMIYLWSYEQARCRDNILEGVYKAVARLLQRYEAEKEAFCGVLDKASRTDVQGHEEELLSPSELEALETWSAKEEKVHIQLQRLDDLVMIFKEFWEIPVW